MEEEKREESTAEVQAEEAVTVEEDRTEAAERSETAYSLLLPPKRTPGRGRAISSPEKKNSAFAVLLFYAGGTGGVQRRERSATRGLPP